MVLAVAFYAASPARSNRPSAVAQMLLRFRDRAIDRRSARDRHAAIREPPVRPIARAGTPRSAASCRSACAFAARHRHDRRERRLAEQRRCGARSTSWRRRRRSRCRRCRSAFRERDREAAVRTVVRGVQQPAGRGRASAARSARAPRARSSAGGVACDQAVHGLQILAAAELAVVLAEQDDRRRRPA